MYHPNIFGSSSKVSGNLRKSWDKFGNFRKFSENVRESSFDLRNNFEKSSESGRKSSKRRHQYVYIKEHYTLARRYEFYVRVARLLFLPLEHKIHIFSPRCNILYIILWVGLFPLYLINVFLLICICSVYVIRFFGRCSRVLDPALDTSPLNWDIVSFAVNFRYMYYDHCLSWDCYLKQKITTLRCYRSVIMVDY